MPSSFAVRPSAYLCVRHCFGSSETNAHVLMYSAYVTATLCVKSRGSRSSRAGKTASAENSCMHAYAVLQHLVRHHSKSPPLTALHEASDGFALSYHTIISLSLMAGVSILEACVSIVQQWSEPRQAMKTVLAECMPRLQSLICASPTAVCCQASIWSIWFNLLPHVAARAGHPGRCFLLQRQCQPLRRGQHHRGYRGR